MYGHPGNNKDPGGEQVAEAVDLELGQVPQDGSPSQIEHQAWPGHVPWSGSVPAPGKLGHPEYIGPDHKPGGQHNNVSKGQGPGGQSEERRKLKEKTKKRKATFKDEIKLQLLAAWINNSDTPFLCQDKKKIRSENC